MNGTKRIIVISIVAVAVLAGTLLFVKPALQRYDQRQIAEMEKRLAVTNYLLATNEKQQIAISEIEFYLEKYSPESVKLSVLTLSVLTLINSNIRKNQGELQEEKIKFEDIIKSTFLVRLKKLSSVSLDVDVLKIRHRAEFLSAQNNQIMLRVIALDIIIFLPDPARAASNLMDAAENLANAERSLKQIEQLFPFD